MPRRLREAVARKLRCGRAESGSGIPGMFGGGCRGPGRGYLGRGGPAGASRSFMGFTAPLVDRVVPLVEL